MSEASEIRKLLNEMPDEHGNPIEAPGMPMPIWTVYYHDGHYDHNLLVKAPNERQALQIIQTEYINKLKNMNAPSAEQMTPEDMEEWEFDKKTMAELDKKGWVLYDHGT